MRCQLTLCLVLANLLFAATASGQGGRFSRTGGFNSGPAVGDPLPDVTVLDETGKEFPLRSLRGEYSVLVFGCLT